MTEAKKTDDKFTKKFLLKIKPPADGIKTYSDPYKRGLKLTVRPSGTKTFILYRKVRGKPERIIIGRFPEMSVEQARRQADIFNAKIAEGINPNEEKRGIRHEMTLKDLFNRYLETYAKVHKKSWEGDSAQYNRYLKDWSSKKLSTIRKLNVQKLHADIGKEHGKYAANRLLALLKTMFNKAIEWGWEHPNPVNGVKKFKEQSRDRFIQADELPRFFKALADETNHTARDYVLLSLLTGARRSNVASMAWKDINLERRTWTIPMTKSGESHTVPLVAEAVKLLAERQKKQHDNKILSLWVFPSHGKSGHLEDPKKAWKRILKRAGIDNLRVHDLRRSLGSWQAATGASLSIIGKTLAHKNASTTAIYARLNLDPVRDSMDKAANAIFEAVRASGEKDDVILNFDEE